MSRLSLRDVAFLGSTSTNNFSPMQFSPAMWLDASDLSTISTSSGNLVSEWRDKSGNNRHLSQSSSLLQPDTGVVTKNGLNVLKFETSNNTSSTVGEYLEGNHWSPSTSAISIFSVVEPTGSSNRVFFSLGSDRSYAVSFRTENDRTYGGLLGTIVWINTSRAGDTSGWSLHAMRRGSGVNAIRRNGVNLTITTGEFSTPLSSAGSMSVGGDIGGGATRRVPCNIAEIIVYDNNFITGSDLTLVEEYLRNKWNLY